MRSLKLGLMLMPVYCGLVWAFVVVACVNLASTVLYFQLVFLWPYRGQVLLLSCLCQVVLV